jgi:glycine/D-amino acid oxidase-like deaminating enzyme
MKIVICGAGVIGAAIACYLARRGVAATLVERTGVACAASGKSGGFIARDWCDGQPQGELARLSFDLHQELAESLQGDHGYRAMHTLSVAASERRDLSAHGRGNVPDWLSPECALGGIIGDPRSTAQIHPQRFTRSLVDTAVQTAGAEVIHGAVDGLLMSRDGSAVGGVTVDGDALEADAVVIAMGPWSDLFRDSLGLPPLGGLKGYSILLEPEQRIPAEALFVEYESSDGSSPSPELVPRPDGQVWLCGMPSSDPLPEDPAQVHVDQQACERLKAIAGTLSPALRNARVVATQACYRPICADAMPLIGRAPAADGAFVATGHNCWGMLNAPATGLAMSELLLDGEATSVDLTALDPARPGIR